MSRRRRAGGRRPPPDGWPLDGLLVGVATLRTMRELYQQEHQWPSEAPRAWDLALWSGVSTQGSANSMERLKRAGLVRASPPSPGRACAYRLDWNHPLAIPLANLFQAERAMLERAHDQIGFTRSAGSRSPPPPVAASPP